MKELAEIVLSFSCVAICIAMGYVGVTSALGAQVTPAGVKQRPIIRMGGPVIDGSRHFLCKATSYMVSFLFFCFCI